MSLLYIDIRSMIKAEHFLVMYWFVLIVMENCAGTEALVHFFLRNETELTRHQYMFCYGKHHPMDLT